MATATTPIPEAIRYSCVLHYALNGLRPRMESTERRRMGWLRTSCRIPSPCHRQQRGDDPATVSFDPLEQIRVTKLVRVALLGMRFSGMALGPFLPSELIELAIYRVVAQFGQEWVANLALLVQAIKHLGVDANNQSAVDSLEYLYTETNINLTKWFEGRWAGRAELNEEDFYYKHTGDFKIRITPSCSSNQSPR